MATVSVIILTHDKWPYTAACLESLLPTSDAELDVIMVDNGSTDGTPDRLRALAPDFEAAGHGLRVLANECNAGCSTARNQGLAVARGEYCAFLDNDVMAVEPTWAARLAQVLGREGAALVGPKLVYPFAPHRIQCAGVGISRSGRVQFRGRGRPRDAAAFAEASECQALISACFMFPRRLYGQIGGLDEAFNPIEYEDLDFCYRARRHGYRALYEPSVEMYHWESITSEGTARLPNTYFIIKHGMLFKSRWRHVFETEDGPADEECVWQRIEVPSLDGKRMR